MILKHAWILLLFPLFLGGVVYFFKKKDSVSSIKFSSSALIEGAQPTLKLFFVKNLFYLRIVAILLFLLALARPMLPMEETKIETEGIDIILVVDSSGSMLAEDFISGNKRKNRLEAVKDVVEDFINERKSDRIGMIAFAARAYTVCPLTLDYDWLISNLGRVEIGAIEDGTAIGSAISSSVSRLKNSKAKSKIVILLTDGVNNAGKIPPLTGAKAAKALGIKIYTVGAGTKGLAPYPVRSLWGDIVYQKVKIEIDEVSLKKISEITGGQYFRATDTKSLKKIYDEINKMETTPVEEGSFKEFKELYYIFLNAGLILIVLEMLLSNTILRKIP